MPITVPPELEPELRDRAHDRKVPPEELLREALGWYLKLDPGLVEELHGWQQIRDEALAIVEDDLA